MARVADYSIIADSVMQSSSTNFSVPDNIHAGSRSVLRFKIKARGYDKRDVPFGSFDGMETKLRLNGNTVWTWNWTNDSNPTRVFQEVIPAGVVKPGENTFSFIVDFDDPDGGLSIIEISDAVLWWQADI
ncbi:hypothetical protein [Roseomonas sp. CECT 9278]|uniref:hypothetical protein n=1 Tax=Roseomonas sp. CECT 9278 TaxID=2845823 RepID=UPI001E341D90|nr:hypothetical protein [Roseomonas sp. CECT 9278]CAH0149341.1 hypothetical protein ROS9278_00678 [Roseomonas sp. CECT 9278]